MTVIARNLAFERLTDIIKQIEEYSSKPLNDFISSHTRKNKKLLLIFCLINLSIWYLGIIPRKINIFGIISTEYVQNPNSIIVMLIAINLYFFLIFIFHTFNDYNNYMHNKRIIMWLCNDRYNIAQKLAYDVIERIIGELTSAFSSSFSIEPTEYRTKLKGKFNQYIKNIRGAFENKNNKLISYQTFFEEEIAIAKKTSSIFNTGIISKFLECEDFYIKLKNLEIVYASIIRNYNKSVFKLIIIYFEYIFPIIFAILSLIITALFAVS